MYSQYTNYYIKMKPQFGGVRSNWKRSLNDSEDDRKTRLAVE